MPFANNHTGTIMSVNDDGRTAVVWMMCNRLDAQTNEYKLDFSSQFVQFKNEAREFVVGLGLPTKEDRKKGDKTAFIRMLEVSTSNAFVDAGGEIRYTSPQHTVWKCEMGKKSASNNSSNAKPNYQKSAPAAQKAKPAQGGMNEVDDDELPF